MVSVSIVVPTYNRAHLLGRTVRSLVLQTYADIEIVVVDDASTDSTPEVLERLSRQDKRVRPIRLKRNSGVAVACNTGIETSQGKYVCTIADDDIAMPELVEASVKALERGADIGFAYSDFVLVRHEDFYIVRTPQSEGITYEEALAGTCPVGPGWFFRRHALVEVGGFDPSLRVAEDWDIFRRIIRAGWRIAHTGIVGAIKFESERMLSRKYALYADTFKAIMRRCEEDFDRFPLAKSKILSVIGMYSMRAGRWKDGLKFLQRSLKEKPAAPIVWLQFLFALGGPSVYSIGDGIYRKLHSAYRTKTVDKNFKQELIQWIKRVESD